MAKPGKKSARTTRATKLSQGVLWNGRGGVREGAGRKPKGTQAMVSHAPRARHAARMPAHVTVKLRQQLPALRRRDAYAALREAFAAGRERFGFRLVHYAILNDHLHFVVEAVDRAARCSRIATTIAP